MSQIQNLRTYIIEALVQKDTVALVDIVASFDFHQHAIPTTNEIRQAIKDIETIEIKRKGEYIILSKTCKNNSSDSNEISDNDVLVTYNLHINKLK